MSFIQVTPFKRVLLISAPYLFKRHMGARNLADWWEIIYIYTSLSVSCCGWNEAQDEGMMQNRVFNDKCLNRTRENGGDNGHNTTLMQDMGTEENTGLINTWNVIREKWNRWEVIKVIGSQNIYQQSSKYLLLCSTKERFETTWGWVNYWINSYFLGELSF